MSQSFITSKLIAPEIRTYNECKGGDHSDPPTCTKCESAEFVEISSHYNNDHEQVYNHCHWVCKNHAPHFNFKNSTSVEGMQHAVNLQREATASFPLCLKCNDNFNVCAAKDDNGVERCFICRVCHTKFDANTRARVEKKKEKQSHAATLIKKHAPARHFGDPVTVRCPECQSSEYAINSGKNRGGDPKYYCKPCNRSYTKDSVKKVQVTHPLCGGINTFKSNGGKYKCKDCNTTFNI